MHVTTTMKPPYRDKVHICSPLLVDMGFAQGTPVRAVPQQHGFTLTLGYEGCMGGYGKLIHVSAAATGKLSITVNLAGNFATTGLSVGDFLAARYEYGAISARRLPEARKYYVVGSRGCDAFLRLSGAWLCDAGFEPDTITVVSTTQDGVTFTAWSDEAARYGDIVKYARRRRCQIIQPKRNQRITVMDVSGYLLGGAGFGIGDIAGVRYEYGSIKLFKPDLRALGL